MYSKFGFSREEFSDFKQHEYIDPYNDPGDYYDIQKWDFPEDLLEVFYIDDYPYKVRKRSSKEASKKKAKQLDSLRKDIRKLCKSLEENSHLWSDKGSFTDGILVFLDIHGEYPRKAEHVPELFYGRIASGKPTSKYLISEIPKENKMYGLIGLNKPKMRHITHEDPIGPDGSIRCGYRDVFLKHDLKGPEMRELVIHELSHTGANHCQWREDDHGKDFTDVEDLIKDLANKYKLKLSF
jgi:hypothetical protein